MNEVQLGKGKDWNEGHPDHEGEMAVTQLHRIAEMANMLLEIIGEDDDLPGWIQYKVTRAYSDLNDAFGYIEAKAHMDGEGMSMEEGKKKKGLWANIHARKKAGKAPRRPGEKNYPKTLKIDESQLRSLIKKIIDES